MNNDFRLPENCHDFDKITAKKHDLAEYIGKSYPKIKNHYSVYLNHKDLRAYFHQVYNYRCSYCGTSISILNIHDLELDHFLCKKIGKEDKALQLQLNQTKNLVLSCRMCNRNKSNLLIPEEYRKILHPDHDHIKSIFVRDNYFRIQISSRYRTNPFIIQFYKKLKLGHYIHQLDFLITEIDSLADSSVISPTIRGLLAQTANQLRQKRNLINY